MDGKHHLSDRNGGETQVQNIAAYFSDSGSHLTSSLCPQSSNSHSAAALLRDVSSVEVLMNYHQSLKSEVEARNKSMVQCIEMGKTLLATRNPAADEVKKNRSVSSFLFQTIPQLYFYSHTGLFQIKEKLEKVLAKQRELTEKWDKHWEELQHSESLRHGAIITLV